MNAGFGVLLLCAVALSAVGQQPNVANREPLAPSKYRMLPLGSVKPQGWLRRQLQIQAAGQTGHLDEFWPSLKQSESGWLGGSGESWERGPYYMDGLVPLAHLLGDPRLIAKANKWVEWTLANQRPNGAIGPAKNTDWWPNMVMLKVLQQHFEATGDKRVIPLMHKYALHHLENAKAQPLKEWAIMRWGEEAMILAWLYNQTGDRKLIDLARILHDQGFDWGKHASAFRWPGKVSKEEAKLPVHGVNNAMAYKYPAVWYLFTGNDADRSATYTLLQQLDKYHLLPAGVHSGDEHYAGRSPVQGTELCTVVEGMYSFEHLLSIIGDPAFGDRLERMTFNALPATFDKTMWSHQYDQQPNQVLCSVHKRDWVSNGPESNLFGLEPNFGCCTANFHQGWPKYVANLWMATGDKGLAAVAYGPSELNTSAGGANVRIVQQTEYPFRDRIRMQIDLNQPATFPIEFRVPAWATSTSIRVNGQLQRGVRPASFHRVSRTWKKGDVVELRFPMTVRFSKWFNDSVAVERGPLVFSLKIGEDWRKLRDKSPAADWEVHPTTPWNYAIDANTRALKVEERVVGDYPFSSEGAPVIITARGRKLPSWGMANGSAAPPPQSPVKSAEPGEMLTLIPYGSAKLRITEFPALASDK